MTRKTLVLTHADICALVDMELAMGAVEEAFRAYAEGRARMPAKVYLDLPEHQGDFRAMPSVLGDYAGVKWVNAHPHNPSRFQLPSVLGTYILSDPKTGFPYALMDATWLTAFRTGAAAGVATRFLANPGFERVGFIGCGVQARMFLQAHRTLGAFDVLAADSDPQAAEAFAREAGGRVASLAEAASCPVVCTATPSTQPLVQRAFVRPGAHINAMGADGPGKQELETALLLSARIIVDEPEQSLHGGELNVPAATGALTASQIAATLGEVICGRKPGRQSTDDITIFDSTGLAIQDLALAAALYEKAQAQQVGSALELVPAR